MLHLGEVPCIPKKTVCSVLVGCGILQMLIILIQLIVLPRSSNPCRLSVYLFYWALYFEFCRITIILNMYYKVTLSVPTLWIPPPLPCFWVGADVAECFSVSAWTSFLSPCAVTGVGTLSPPLPLLWWVAHHCYSLLFSRPVVSSSLWPRGLQHARLPGPPLSPGACPNSSASSPWWHPTVSPSVAPSPPALSLSQHQGLFQLVDSSHQVAKVSELQHQSFTLSWPRYWTRVSKVAGESFTIWANQRRPVYLLLSAF